MFVSLCLFIASFVIGIITYPKFIHLMKQMASQPIYLDALPSHSKKSGTPSMGGLWIILITFTLSLLYYQHNFQNIAIIFALFSFTIIGIIDDVLKFRSKNTRRAMSAKLKFVLQVVCAAITLWIMNQHQKLGLVHLWPNFALDFGYAYYFFGIFIIVGSSNAFNLTDGLDGLAIFPFILNCLFFLIISICIKDKLDNIFLITIYLILIGSSLSFLWFNSKTASIFMGDSGSLPLGAFLGLSSIMLNAELPFIFSSFIFIVEAVSVILQVGYFKLTKGKRLFLIAPIHHHFEKCGIEENKIVARAWILSIIGTIIALFVYFYLNNV